MATLSQQVKNAFSSRDRNAVTMLQLVHDCVVHMGTYHDWDAAAQFLQYATKAKDQIPNRVMRAAIRLYFGPALKLGNDPKHPTGFRFSFGADGKWPTSDDGLPYIINPGNHFGVIQRAVENKVAIHNSDFLKALTAETKKLIPEKEMTQQQKDAAARAAIERQAKAVAKKLLSEGISTTLFMRELEAEYATQKVEAGKLTANVSNKVAKPKADNITTHDELLDASNTKVA